MAFEVEGAPLRGRIEQRSSARSAIVLLVLAVLALIGGCTGEILEPEGKPSGPPSSSIQSGDGCPTGQVSCAGRCTNIGSDSLSCGACDRACPSGLVCLAQQCTRLCGTGDLECGGACVPVQGDAANCGSCGHACAPGEFCSAGACSATCAFQVCQTASGYDCADVQTNSRHCGACNAACGPGQSCVSGICQLVCPAGQAPCGGRCVATGTDASNCGGCGIACAPGVACIGGSCGCPPGTALCGGACQDVASNPRSCGYCGHDCGPGSTCAGGQCTCAPGAVLCGTTCAVLASDVQHCGDCARACAATEICDQSVCKPRTSGCSPGLALCGTSCVDTLSSTAHCGVCDRACAPAELCVGGNCGCPGGQRLCGGACVDVTTSNAHCGGCDAPCTAGRSCVAGACACPPGQQFCGGACVDVASNGTHCGGCDRPCDVGKSCVASACACPPGTEPCAGGCVDTQTSGDHCGACDAPCAGGSVCTAGSCTCAEGQTLCGGACVDTATSLTHCGGCDHACFGTEVCTAGKCQGPLGADGCSGSALGITVSSIAVYQSLKIPVMDGGQAIGRGSRVADVIEGRETLFRVFVQPGAGFGARELSARLTVTNGGAPDQYFAKRTVSGASNDADQASTFNVFVPPEKILADTRYAVELVECAGVPSGSGGSPRFPASGDVALEARRTGPLKIAIVPVAANNRVADTSEAALTVYRNYLKAMYPTSEVQLSVTSQLSTGYPINWTGLLDQVRAKRQSEGVAGDVYYYGFLKPTDSFREFCQLSCTAGIGYVGGANQASSRAAVGLAFVDETSAATMAHEVGHNHGRNHAPCAPGQISGVDSGYPSDPAHSGAHLGVWGYDARTRVLYDPARWTDIMGYCSNKWVSDYTYRGFTERVAALNGAQLLFVPDEMLAPWQVLILDSDGPRWGVPYDRPGEAFGYPEPADILDASGDAIGQVTVYRALVGDLDAATVFVPPPEPGWHSVRVTGWPPIAFSLPGAAPSP